MRMVVHPKSRERPDNIVPERKRRVNRPGLGTASPFCRERLLPAALALLLLVASDAIAISASNSTCDVAEIGGFDRAPSPVYRLTTNFPVKPDADANEVRSDITNLHVLADLSVGRSYQASSGQCTFSAGANTPLNLSFELYSINQSIPDECSLSRCVRLLWQLIESVAPDEVEFSRTIDRLVAARRRSDSVDFRYPGLAARNALQEVYRHVYPAETREGILVNISSRDFLRIDFAEFKAWLKVQQAVLRNANERKELRPPVAPAPPAPMGSTPRGRTGDLDIEELEIERHGWGHQSIAVIRNAWGREGIAGIENAALRALCHPNENNAVREVELWREMAGRFACRREVLGQDKWLAVYSKREPPATPTEMVRVAYAIAGAFKSDQSAPSGLRIIVANFLRSR
jgi:hypothetical protein